MKAIKTTILAAFALAGDLCLGALALVRALVFGGVSFLRDLWAQYLPFGQALFLLGLCATVIDASVAAAYGAETTKLHAAGFALVAVAWCLLPDVAVTEARKKNYGGAVTMCVGSFFMGLVALQSHIGYGGSIRKAQMQQTNFQHAKAGAVQSLADSEGVNLQMWRDTLAEQKATRAKLRTGNPFVTTIKADALRAELKTITERMAAEEAGQRGRNKGRGKAFEGLQDQEKGLRERIAVVEKEDTLSASIISLEEKIAATQRVLDAKTATVAATGYDSNAIVNQNDILVSLVMFARGEWGNAAIQPTAVQREVANTAVTGFNSIGFLIAGPLLVVAAGFYRVFGAAGLGGGVHVPMAAAGGSGGAPAAPQAPSQPGPSMTAVNDRRLAVQAKLLGMRQSRVDGGLILNRAA